MTRTVVKIGGSLVDRPDLGPALRNWLAALAPTELLLVPGGGPLAEVVRDYDRRFALGEEASHWLALRVMTVNAHMLAAVLGGRVVSGWDECGSLGVISILDGFAFAVADDSLPGRLPHAWAATSDSLAARVAVVGGAGRLILLKSLTIPAGTDWSEAVLRGWVDAHFPEAIRGTGLVVEVVDFRAGR